MRSKNRVWLLSLMTLLSGCTQLDNYLLGKDNTPTPTPLQELKPKIQFTKKWSIATSRPSKAAADLKLAPFLSGNILYTASADGTVQAIDHRQGKILWSKQLPAHLLSGPALGKGVLAVTTNASTLLVLNPSNGNLLWKANLSSDALGKPVIADNMLLAKTIDGNVYAFKSESGEKLWVVDHGSPNLILKASSSPVLFDKAALVGFSDGKLDAINLATGQVLWQRNIAYSPGGSDIEHLVDIDADPIIKDDLVYLASYQGYIGALSLKTGEFIWRKPASIYKNLIIHDRTIVYVDSDSTVWALNRFTGKVLWKQEGLKARGLTEPVKMGNQILLGDKSGFLHGLDIRNGELVSRTQLNAPMYSAPVVSGRQVYALTTNGQLTLLSEQ